MLCGQELRAKAEEYEELAARHVAVQAWMNRRHEQEVRCLSVRCERADQKSAGMQGLVGDFAVCVQLCVVPGADASFSWEKVEWLMTIDQKDR